MNVGIVSPYQRGGYGYTALDIKKVLTSYKHNVFILAKNPFNKDEVEFHNPPVEYYEENIPSKLLQFWIKKNKLDKVIFLGCDKRKELLNIIDIMPSVNVRTKFIIIPMWELIDNINAYRFFDKIICPTKKCFSLFKDFPKAKYIKWGFDPDIFKPSEKLENNNTLRIFHPVGKETEDSLSVKALCLKSFLITKRIKVSDIGELTTTSLLYIHSLGSGADNVHYNLMNIVIGKQNLNRTEMAFLYTCADVCLLPSNIEGLGLSFLEAIGAGLPIITIDEAPMNEYIKDRYNGFLVKRNDNLKGFLNISMNYLERDKQLLMNMKQNALSIRDDWSWKTNGKALEEAICND